MTDTDWFPAASKIVLALEGVYSDQAGDLGGETKWGVARNKHPEIPPEKWNAWTQADSVALFKAQYWDKHRLGELPWHWALAIFDGQINQGSVIGLAQSAVSGGNIEIDGVMGDHTIAALKTADDEALDIFLALRGLRYTMAPGFSKDGKGWLKRLARIARATAVTPAVA